MYIIYIHKIYRNSKLFANSVTYCLHYVYILINTLVHRHNSKETLFIKSTLVKFQYIYVFKST